MHNACSIYTQTSGPICINRHSTERTGPVCGGEGRDGQLTHRETGRTQSNGTHTGRTGTGGRQADCAGPQESQHP